MGQHHSLKTLHDDWSDCYWPVVVQTGRGALLGKGIDGCGFEAGWDGALTEGEFKDGSEYISQLCRTSSEGPPRDVVWPCCLVGVDLP